MSNVYFIQAGDENVFKIGITNGSPSKRLAMLQTGNHLPLTVYAFMSVSEPKEVEARLHSQYGDRRMAGEWFNLTPQEVDRILEHENAGRTSPFVEVLKLDDRGKECQHYLYEKETGILYSDVQNWRKVFKGTYWYLLFTCIKFYMDQRAYADYDDIVEMAGNDPEAIADLLDYKQRLTTAALKFQRGQQAVML